MHFKTNSQPSLARKWKLQSYSPGNAVATALMPYKSAAMRPASVAPMATAARSSRNMPEILSAFGGHRPFAADVETWHLDALPALKSKCGYEDRMNTRFRQGNFHAYQFDGDGTSAESMPLRYTGWKQALEEWNCDFAEK